MICKKCKKEIADGSTFCNWCGKKQTAVPRTRHRKRAHGTGTISKDNRYKNPYIVHAPSTRNGQGRIYIGSYPDIKTAQAALEDYIKNGRPELYNATLEDIYKIWSATHFKRVGESAVKLYSSMWKRFNKIKNIKMSDLRTTHFQEIINNCTSKSSAEILKALSVMLCKCAMENDLITKNYAEFTKLPKFEKKQKVIFTDEQIAELWKHSEDKRIQVILTMIYMGFRIGEISSLKPENVHLAEGYIIGGEKTEAGKNRIIPFPISIPEIKQFVENWVKEVESDEEIFPITKNEFRNVYFYQPLIELGMLVGHPRSKAKESTYIFSGEHLTPHSTRHTFASLSAAAGMRQENLQKIIGHANYSTTADVYIHQDFKNLQSEMSKLKR